jgi:uncharacterized protein DUF6916
MRALTLDEFKPLEGGSFELVLGTRTIPFALSAVRALPDSGREGGAFVLEWLGPYEPVLSQDIYAIRHGDEEFEIFIVPLGRDRAGTQYEAIFN